MKSVVFFFEAHQPKRLREFRSLDIGKNKSYFWDEKNEEIINRVSDRCYIPATQTLIDKKIKATISISGILLEHLINKREDVVDVFKEYFRKGGELAGETFYHSLSSIWSPEEFSDQVNEDKTMKKEIFGIVPRTFRNTEMIYSDDIAFLSAKEGFKNILTEGPDRIIDEYNPNYVYKSVASQSLFLRNYRLSDDISFRFSNPSWNEHPLYADKYANWIASSPGDIVNLFMDYETFGEHQWKESGIFEFLSALPDELEKRSIKFSTVSEASELQTDRKISIKEYISWADYPRDLSAWLANDMQRDAFEDMKSLQKCKDKKTWRYLQTSDHFYYMSLAAVQDQEVHTYFNPYGSPYDAYIFYKNILEDFREKCQDS